MSELPAQDMNDPYAPATVAYKRKMQYDFLESGEEPHSQQDSTEWDVPIPLDNSVSAPTHLNHTLVEPTLYKSAAPPHTAPALKEIEVKISGCRLKLPVVDVSINSRGIAIMLPPGRVFELDFEAELVITFRGKSYNVISFDQFYPFIGLDCSFVAFMFVSND